MIAVRHSLMVDTLYFDIETLYFYVLSYVRPLLMSIFKEIIFTSFYVYINLGIKTNHAFKGLKEVLTSIYDAVKCDP